MVGAPETVWCGQLCLPTHTPLSLRGTVIALLAHASVGAGEQTDPVKSEVAFVLQGSVGKRHVERHEGGFNLGGGFYKKTQFCRSQSQST